MPDIKVLIADDHPIVCSGIHNLLEKAVGIKVVGEAYSGAETLEKIKSLKPDVLLLDMELSDMSGVEVIKQLNEAPASSMRVLGLSSYDDREFISQLLSNGASGYLLKDEVPKQIVDAIRGVARGETGWVSRKVAAKLSQILQREKEGGTDLTPRELEVLRLIADGLSNSEIAAALLISQETVKTFVSRILAKLGLRDRVQAVVYAYRRGLVT